MNVRLVCTMAVAWAVIARPSAGQSVQRADNSAVRAQIVANWRKFEASLKSGDSMSVGRTFSPGAIQAFTTETGPDSVRTYWNRMLRTYKWEEVTYTTEDFGVGGDLAYEFGVGTQRYRRITGGGDPTIQRFRYAAVWQRQSDGSWKLHRWIVTLARLPG